MNQHVLDLLLSHAKDLGLVVLFEPPNEWRLIPDPRTAEEPKEDER